MQAQFNMGRVSDSLSSAWTWWLLQGPSLSKAGRKCNSQPETSTPLSPTQMGQPPGVGCLCVLTEAVSHSQCACCQLAPGVTNIVLEQKTPVG